MELDAYRPNTTLTTFCEAPADCADPANFYLAKITELMAQLSKAEAKMLNSLRERDALVDQLNAIAERNRLGMFA